MSTATNCWEFQKCKPDLRDACPAYPNNGHDCWKVTGTLCKGIQQKDMATKIHQCRTCNFYKSGNAKKY